MLLTYSADNDIPVSYTHLDVYKRQSVSREMIRALRSCQTSAALQDHRHRCAGKPPLPHDAPVSYTHLDVYKRQVGILRIKIHIRDHAVLISDGQILRPIMGRFLVLGAMCIRDSFDIVLLQICIRKMKNP